MMASPGRITFDVSLAIDGLLLIVRSSREHEIAELATKE